MNASTLGCSNLVASSRELCGGCQVTRGTKISFVVLCGFVFLNVIIHRVLYGLIRVLCFFFFFFLSFHIVFWFCFYNYYHYYVVFFIKCNCWPY